jgi:thermolabile hemolysin
VVRNRFPLRGLGGLLLLAAGCVPPLHDPAPSRSPDLQRSPWLVHCETAESHAPQEEAAPGVHRGRWIWANDDQGRAIELEGRLEDGFLVVTGRREPQLSEPLPASLPDLREACLRTLRARDPDAPMELGKVRAARHGEDIDVTMVFPPAAPPTHPVRRMVVFGDSLSDTGRLKRRVKVLPASPYWLGRFSNGPNWVDYLAAASGIAMQNHAYGGAAVTHHEHIPDEELLARMKQAGQLLVTGSLERQVDDYLANNLAGSEVQQPDRTVFVIWAGANDYIWKEAFSGEITTFLNSPRGAAGYARIVDEVIGTIAALVRKLHAAGARRFLLINLPDLGKTPIVLQNKTYFPPRPPGSEEARKLELSSRLSALTAYHNQQLRTRIARLEEELPDLQLLHQDAAASVDGILDAPTDYGFELAANLETLSHGERRAELQRRCYAGGYLGSSHPGDVCKHEARVVFWDVVHPTSYTHCWQAWLIGGTLARAGWIAPLPTPDAYRAWCEQVAGDQPGHREAAWRLSGL